MSLKPALHRLLCKLFSTEELRQYIVQGHAGDELQMELPEGSISRNNLTKEVVDALYKRHMINQAFFDSLEKDRPLHKIEIQAVRKLLPDDNITHHITITSSDYFGKIDPTASYYALTLVADNEGKRVNITQTHFIGWADGKPGIELRAPSRIHPERMISLWKEIGESPVAVINNSAQFISYCLHLGGNAIITTAVAEEWLPDLFKPGPAVRMGIGAGFSSSKQDLDASSQRSPLPKQRMNVLMRDDLRCRVCGRGAEDSSDVRLEVVHIHPFTEGGPTLPWNLITLCQKCRQGSDPRHQFHLHRKLEDPLARLAGEATRYQAGVLRWRSMIKKQFTLSTVTSDDQHKKR